MSNLLNKIFEAPRLFFEDNLTRAMSKLGLHDMEATVARTFGHPEPLRPLVDFMDRSGLTTRALLRQYNERYPDKRLPDPYDDYNQF